MAESQAYQSWSKRMQKYRASKTQIFWACAACVVATMIVGFSWGGWVTGASARDMATKAAANARAELAAAICIHQFAGDPDVAAKLAALKGTESWKRNDYIEKGGWAAVPGVAGAVKGAAELCAKQLVDATPAPAKAAGTSG
jgi:hypothetical protein